MRKKYERAFDRFCEKTGIDPARLLPHIQVPSTIRQMGTRYSKEQAKKAAQSGIPEVGTRVDMSFHSIYELAWLWANTTRPNGFWDEFWGFLHEINVGIYTPSKYWEPVDVVSIKEELDQ